MIEGKMEVHAAAPAAASASVEKPKSSEEGFGKVLDRAKADIAPPSSPPPNKEAKTQAGEVAETEQKTPPQKLDSQPDQGTNAAQSATLNPALLATLASLPVAASLKDAEQVDPKSTPDAPKVVAAGTAAVAQKSAIDLKAAKLSEEGTEDPTSTHETDAKSEGDASKGVSIKSLAHPDLGKVQVKVQKLSRTEESNSDGASKENSQEESTSPSLGVTVPTKGDSSSVALTVTAPKPLASLEAAPTTPPLSNEHRNLMFRQVSDRMELLAASRPREAVTIHLQPQDLGDVTVIIKNVGAKMSAELFATNDGVRDALKQDSSKLAEQLQSKGVAITHVAVNQSAQSQKTGSNTHYRDRHNPSTSQNNGDAHAQQRNQREARQGTYSPLALKTSPAAKARYAIRRTTAVDLSI